MKGGSKSTNEQFNEIKDTLTKVIDRIIGIEIKLGERKVSNPLIEDMIRTLRATGRYTEEEINFFSRGSGE